MNNNPDFKTRNTLLIKALLGNKNTEDNILTIASKLFEVMTGRTLYRETDMINGEDFYYKGGTQECMSSIRFHPEVANWFGWFTNSLHSSLDHRQELVHQFKDSSAVIDALRTNAQAFKKPVPCMDSILLNDKPYMSGDDMYHFFEQMTGAAFFVNTPMYDEGNHTAFHEYIESSTGIALTGELTFKNALGQVTDYGNVKSLSHGANKKDLEQIAN